MPFLNKDARNPVTMPDGTVLEEVVYLKNAIDIPQIEVGDYSYYSSFGRPENIAAAIAPYLFPHSREKLIIGKFAQIAHGAQFITSSANHPMGGVTAYPFRLFNLDTVRDYTEMPVKDTVVGNDVWFGHEAMVMPGVTIGDGAIVAARAVVTRDVAPYTIVGGNPAAVIRKRFSDEVIADLLEIRWWDWPVEAIEDNLEALETADMERLKAVHRSL
ncbi:virginiamycin A acetyltransferase [Rhodobium orientis]|uniref:Acetyltransferase n=1 Tax=Rhodobium orientis TaxID=34017 RepID=A0A327JV71_9HYPH|nr:CatB-related O-acetyltransferase [Rhodobium orientis]MBB4302985.1 virginiamycin A acetyltransferase [Rhodobium orientis]MBK5949546.1 acetyltransferase [Rhodobium orientis]RAI29404.1 acetyltransferase [Rhodobium orientis]